MQELLLYLYSTGFAEWMSTSNGKVDSSDTVYFWHSLSYINRSGATDFPVAQVLHRHYSGQVLASVITVAPRHDGYFVWLLLRARLHPAGRSKDKAACSWTCRHQELPPTIGDPSRKGKPWANCRTCT